MCRRHLKACFSCGSLSHRIISCHVKKSSHNSTEFIGARAQGSKEPGHKTCSISPCKTFETSGASDHQDHVKGAISSDDQLRVVGSRSQFRKSRKQIGNEVLHTGNSAVYGLAACHELCSSLEKVRKESEDLPHKIDVLQIAKHWQSLSSGYKRREAAFATDKHSRIGDQTCEKQKRESETRVAEPLMEQSSEEFDHISKKPKESLMLYRYRLENAYRRKYPTNDVSVRYC